MTSNGSHLLAYVPPRVAGKRWLTREWLRAHVPFASGSGGERAFEVDLGALGGPVRARWFDPAAGGFVPITAGYEVANAGRRRFETPPGRRGDGSDDWLLVLDAQPADGRGRAPSPAGHHDRRR